MPSASSPAQSSSRGAGNPPEGLAPSVPFAWLHAWRERLYARRCCRQLLALHDRLCVEDPALRGEALYARVVRQHLGLDADAADEVIARAQESYSDWPSVRPLSFRDVVHYLAVSGLCGRPGARGWVLADVRPVIERWIPTRM
jgi:hypothetical protein